MTDTDAAGVPQASRLIAATRAQVWAALTEADLRAQWWDGMEFDARVGARLEESWSDGTGTVHVTEGTVRVVEEGERLEFDWIDEGWAAPSRVAITLEDGASGVTVSVAETGLPDSPGLAAEHQEGWEMHLGHLASVAASAPVR
ncbi:SRPBCC family protein [Prauserella halophila]|uniref:SRPBCC family protein n=1 Tax=Prauserella halophila TaxID=185641 RepID=UPI0020A5A128|nr:SRPBCC domain-containing protein [Prauserella halophila]